MVDAGHSGEKKFKSHFTHMCTSALPPKQCKTSKNLFLFNYIFINIIQLPYPMYSKWCWNGIVQIKVNPHVIHLCISALTHKQCKLVKNRFLFNYIFTNHYFTSVFDVFEMVGVGHSREKNWNLNSVICALLHSRLKLTSVICALLHSRLNSAKL